LSEQRQEPFVTDRREYIIGKIKSLRQLHHEARKWRTAGRNLLAELDERQRA
jgi:hypothetical protein